MYHLILLQESQLPMVIQQSLGRELGKKTGQVYILFFFIKLDNIATRRLRFGRNKF